MARSTGRRRADRVQTARAETVRSGRELAALVDGPWAPRWYWRDELEAMQAASRRAGHPEGHPSAALRAYRPTGERVPHPHHPDHDGRAWRHHPPEPDAIEPAAAARVAQAHRAVQITTAPQIPTPRRPLDDETTRREQLHRIHHDRQQHEETAQDGHEREGVLW